MAITRRQLLVRSLALPFLPRAFLSQAVAPNIVLITADDLGYGSLGCYGQQTIQTPRLDALAAGGRRFTQAYAPSCVCAPSRWSLMTGQHIGQAPTAINSETGLRVEDETVAQCLKKAGYSTACIGKWGLGYSGSGQQNSPREKGFDYFLGYLLHGEAHNYYLPYIWENETYTPLPANQNGQQGLYIPDLLTSKATQFISQARPPFFLYLPFTLPHVNSGTGAFEVPTAAPYSGMPWSQDEKDYAAMITRLDSYVGQIIQALPANTIIIFTSDNGSDYPQMFQSNGDLRAGKSTLYEGGIRVPLIVSGPGIPVGVEDAPAWLVNFSKVALSGDACQFVEPGPMYWTFEGAGLVEAVRVGDWKGVRIGDEWELFDLASDPGEAVNLAAGNPGPIWQMGVIMDRYCPAPKVCRAWLPIMTM